MKIHANEIGDDEDRGTFERERMFSTKEEEDEMFLGKLVRDVAAFRASTVNVALREKESKGKNQLEIHL